MTRLARLVLRAISILVGVLLLVCVAAAVVVVVKRDELMRWGLQIAAEKTGAAISVSSLDLGVATSGLEIVANDASVNYQGKAARAKRIDAIIGYMQLMRLRVLPLKSLSLAEPVVTIAPPSARASRPANQSFDLKRYVATLPGLATKVAGLVQTAAIVNGRVSLENIKAANEPAPSIDLNVTIDAAEMALKVAIQRVAWNGPPVDGFSFSAGFTIPTQKAQQAKLASGTVDFIRRSQVGLNGQLQLAVSKEEALSGQFRVHAASVPKLGQAGFEGSYTLAADQFELAGDLLLPAGLGLSEKVPVKTSIAEQFSDNPKVDFNAGPVQIRVERLNEALVLAPTAPVSGELDVQRVQFATQLAPWREAFAHCSDADCKQQAMLNALLSVTSAALLISGADVSADSVPALASLRKFGLVSLQLDAPARFSLENGVASSNNLAARIGPLAATHGQFRFDARPTQSAGGIRAAYTGGFFATADLSQPGLQAMLPPKARKLLRSHGVLYAQAYFGGTLTNDGGRMAARNPWFELSQGFVQLNDHGAPNALVFGARAQLGRRTLVSSAHVAALSGGTVAADSRLALSNRTLRARVNISHLDAWRWYRTLVQDSSLSKVRVSGHAGGQISVFWRMAREAPRLNGALIVNGLSIESPYTKHTVLVRTTRVSFDGHGAAMSANTVTLGAGKFNVDAKVPDFANPSLSLAIFGNSFDVDAINFASSSASAGAQAKASGKPTHLTKSATTARPGKPARPADNSPSATSASTDGNAPTGAAVKSRPGANPVALSGSVNLRSVFYHGVRMEDVSGQFGGKGNLWTVRNFSAKTLRGVVKLAAAWNGDESQLFLTGVVSKIDARLLFVALGSKDSQPVSGELSVNLNAGVFFPGAGESPVLSCGGSTIVIAHGALGKADVLVRIMQLLNVESWLTFNPPDLDKTGLPFEKILARLTFMPEAITVKQLQLTGPVLRLVGHGQMAMPERRLDLHLAAMPFTSPRWALDAVPFVGPRLGHTFDEIFAVRISVTGPASSSDVAPEFFGSVIDALVGVIELPLDFVPENLVPEAIAPPATESTGAFNKCQPPP